jgi:septal ring factor EnvC (AmiA/AmiB activator)
MEGKGPVPNRMKQFRDPLMDSFGGQAKKDAEAAYSSRQNGSSALKIVIGVALLAVLGTLGYFLYDSQKQIRDLSNSLVAGQERLSEVNQSLQESQQQLGELQTGLSESGKQLNAQKREIGRYQTLYQNLKEEQGEQTRELEAISIKKADQQSVDALRDQTAGIENQVGEMDVRMGQVSSNISDLREQTTRNRQDIEGAASSLESLGTAVEGNRQEIAGVKRSLDREYYNFELLKNGGIMKVFDIALTLKKVNFKDQRFTLEILADGKRINKKGQSINEPIYFYLEGQKKPYEVVVNRVDKNLVVGYLSVPKS